MKKYKKIVDFDKFISLRIKNNEIKKIKKIIRKNKDKYKNISHYIRCAIIKFNKQEGDNKNVK